MKLLRLKNTKKRGLMEFFGYSEKDRFIGVCLSFDIIEEGKNQIEVMKSVEEAAILHLKTVCKKNLSDDLLNRYAPQEYWDKYFEFQKKIIEEKPLRIKSESAKQFEYDSKSLSLVGC